MTNFKSCTCKRCQSLCRNPGWFTPDEARAAIAAGYADRLMVDYFIKAENVFVLCPASEGCAKNRAPNSDELGGMVAALLNGQLDPKGRCVLQTDDGLCSLHETSLKPAQCRSAMACEDVYGLRNAEIVTGWDNPEAQGLVREWMGLVGLDPTALERCY